MKPIELIWRCTAARNRFQMRQAALWWKDTGDQAMLDLAIERRDTAKAADQYAEQFARKERAA